MEWDLKENPRRTGATFETLGKKGRGYMEIGTKWKTEQHRLDVLFHEILEAILVVDNKRFENERNADETDKMFIFDHDYLEALPYKIIDALVSCGEISLKGK